MGIADWGQKESAAGIAFRTQFFSFKGCLPHFFFVLFPSYKREPESSEQAPKRGRAVQLPSFCRPRRQRALSGVHGAAFIFQPGGLFPILFCLSGLPGRDTAMGGAQASALDAVAANRKGQISLSLWREQDLRLRARLGLAG